MDAVGGKRTATKEQALQSFFDSQTKESYWTSTTFTGTLTNFFLLNNGYHLAHHFRPYIHWSLLPEMHKKYVAPRLEPYQFALSHPNMLAFIFRTFIWPGQRKTYDGKEVVFDDPDTIGDDEAWVKYPEATSLEGQNSQLDPWVNREPQLGRFALVVDLLADILTGGALWRSLAYNTGFQKSTDFRPADYIALALSKLVSPNYSPNIKI